VRKTSVYLTDDETRHLAAMARREGASQAEVIRRAIKRYEPQGAGDRSFSLLRIADGPGDSIADLSEDELLKDFGS